MSDRILICSVRDVSKDSHVHEQHDAMIQKVIEQHRIGRK